jgi:histidyl-tRNA synthetase
MPQYQAPRGMRDLLPAEAAQIARIEAVFAARAERHGYLRIETPAVEEREVFLRTAGEASDVGGKEMYEVSLHGQGGLALRPEATAALGRFYLQHGLHRAPQPVRIYCVERMYRGQRPQLLRYREFRQWDVECFGAPEPAADIEIVAFTSGLLQELGLVDVELRINTIGDTASRARVNDALRAYFERFEDELDADCRQRLRTGVLRIFDCKVPHDQEIAAGAPRVRELVSDEDRRHFATVLEGLDRLGVRYEVDDRLVRGFDYYTRTVFELVLTDPEFTKAGRISVAGGGRYDGLVRTMGGPEMPGIGVAGGIEVLHAALVRQGVALGDEASPDVYVVSGRSDDVAERHQLAEPLRDAGFTVAIDYTSRPLDRQLESAVKHGAKLAVIRGTPEARGGNVIVRQLERREQRVTRLAAVVAEVRRHVPQYPKPTLLPPTGGLQSEE